LVPSSTNDAFVADVRAAEAAHVDTVLVKHNKHEFVPEMMHIADTFIVEQALQVSNVRTALQARSESR
jgi:urease alpha subunit